MALQKWILLLAVVVVVRAAEPKVEIKVHPASEIAQGQVVTVECDIVGDIQRTAAFYLQRIANGVSSKVADIQRVADDFMDQGRFSMEYTGVEGHMNFTVKIEDIQGSDSGVLKCVFTQGGKEVTADQDINVLVPVASVQIVQITNTSTIPVPEGQDVNLEHKNNAGVGCLTKVEGTDAVPTIRINTTTNVKFENISSLEQEVIKGQWIVNREELRRYKESKPNLLLHGKTIRCVAELPGFPSKEATAVMRVFSVPEVNCERTQSAKIGETATLTCNVKSSPSPDMDKTMWIWRPKQGNKTTLSVDDSLPRYAAKLEDKGNHLDYVVTLDIDAVETADFVNYKLEIVNDQGEIRQAVQLEEVVTTTTTTTLAPTTTTPTTTLSTTTPAITDDGSPASVVDDIGGSDCQVYSLMLTLVSLVIASLLSTS